MARSLTRRSLGAAAAALAGSIVSRRVAAQVTDPRPPLVDTSNLQEVAPGVWIVRDHRTWLVPNIGIILGADAALVVDTGLGPVNGERVMALARQLAGQRRLYLTLTHFHPEHGYGAQVFERDATILYNRAQRDELEAKGELYLGLFRKTQSKAAADALDGTRLVMPNVAYDGARADLDLGGRKVEFHTWGTAHSRGDQVVFLPEERILFAGDLIEERMFPIFPWFPPDDTDVDADRWAGILNAFDSFNPSLIIPGHGDPGDLRIARDLASYIVDVGQGIRTLRKAGWTAERVATEYKPKIIAAHPSWEHPGLIDWQLNYFNANPA